MFSPWLFFIRKPSLSGEELAQKEPRLSWVRRGYPVRMVLWIALMAIIHFGVGKVLEPMVGDQVFNLFGSFVATLACFDGLFAIRTGVYSVSTKVSYRYVYENSKYLRRVAVFQIVCSLALILYIGITLVIAASK
jgi:hypothetical protein